MKKFGWGIVTGVAGTLAGVIGAGKIFHTIAIKPIEEEEAKFEATELRGARKAGNSHTPR